MLVTVLPPISSNYLKSFDFDFFIFLTTWQAVLRLCYYVILLLMSVSYCLSFHSIKSFISVIDWIEQGMLEPIPTFVKKNKRGIGADKTKKKVEVPKDLDAKMQNNHVSN